MTTDATPANVRCNDGLDARIRSALTLDGPTVVSFSGGRTSAYMLHRLLMAHGGKLPADMPGPMRAKDDNGGQELLFEAEASI